MAMNDAIDVTHHQAKLTHKICKLLKYVTVDLTAIILLLLLFHCIGWNELENIAILGSQPTGCIYMQM